MAAALLVLLLLLAVPLIALTTTDVYYVTADDAEQSCPSHQICHNLSYYISQQYSFFTSDTTIIFLEGEHSFDREELVHVSNVNNLTLKGQGQWPVAGPEDTVMKSTVIINCARERGGFYFDSSHNITVEGLTVVNCGGLNKKAVMYFDTVMNLFFLKNSIQHMTGYGLFVLNCDHVIITNCSYYHSLWCNISRSLEFNYNNGTQYAAYGGGVGIVYDTQNSNTLELSHSNMTNCCSIQQGGGGIFLQAKSRFGSVRVLLSHLVLSHNSASHKLLNEKSGAGLGAVMTGNGNVSLSISNCLFFHGHAFGQGTGGVHFFVDTTKVVITIQNTDLVENEGFIGSEIYFQSSNSHDSSLSILNSTITHTETTSLNGVIIKGCCTRVIFNNTRMRLTKLIKSGVLVDGHNQGLGNSTDAQTMAMDNCIIEKSQSETALLHVSGIQYLINNCTFSNNSGNQSVIMIHRSIDINLDNYCIWKNIPTHCGIIRETR